MILYQVTWIVEPELKQGKGRALKSEKNYFTFSVLCRNSKDALNCALWYFKSEFTSNVRYSFDDGKIEMKRSIIDSRNFNPSYLFMDDIPYPLNLSDLKSSLLGIHKRYNV